MMATSYKLPSGVALEPGGRVRIPRDQWPLISEDDRRRFGLSLVKHAASPGSVVVRRAGDL